MYTMTRFFERKNAKIHVLGLSSFITDYVPITHCSYRPGPFPGVPGCQVKQSVEALQCSHPGLFPKLSDIMELLCLSVISLNSNEE